MLNSVQASRFIKQVSVGKTNPYRIECEASDGSLVELIVKYSFGCQENTKSLINEAISAMLAADLNLPVPEPFVVEIDDIFIDSQLDRLVQSRLRQSSKYAFGSKVVPSGYIVWPNGIDVPKGLLKDATEVFIFDAIVRNPDRRPINPNCLYSGDKIAIIDHELTFGIMLRWIEPWLSGGFNDQNKREQHIFAKHYIKNPPTNLDGFIQSWKSITNDRFEAYKRALPPEWISSQTYMDKLIKDLTEARDNIEAVVEKALEALK